MSLGPWHLLVQTLQANCKTKKNLARTIPAPPNATRLHAARHRQRHGRRPEPRKTPAIPRAETDTSPPNATLLHAARHRQRHHRTPKLRKTPGTPRARTGTAPPNTTHLHAPRHRQIRSVCVCVCKCEAGLLIGASVGAGPGTRVQTKRSCQQRIENQDAAND